MAPGGVRDPRSTAPASLLGCRHLVEAPNRLRKNHGAGAICRVVTRNSLLSCRERATEAGTYVDFDVFCYRWADPGQSPAVTTPRPLPAWSAGRDCRPWPRG